jgi:hypothetical protein
VLEQLRCFRVFIIYSIPVSNTHKCVMHLNRWIFGILYMELLEFHGTLL